MHMTNKNILEIAMRQSALDANCNAEDFIREDNVIVISAANSGARKYLNLEELKALNCPYELRVLHSEDFDALYTDQWSNALCKKRRELDVLGISAYDGIKLVGLAGCSADCETMWQIGVDVLPEYRRQNIASALTSRLALEILEREKVPFYCAAWSNIRSVRNAIKSGFRPAWVETTVKSVSFVNEMNEGKYLLSQHC